jgi:hypothetical protein
MSRGTRNRGVYNAGSRYQAANSEGTADRQVLVRTPVNCRVSELAMAL